MKSKNDDLKEAVQEAARNSIVSLFENHPENFYYCSLVTDGFGNCPILTAWSKEALEKILSTEDSPEEARSELKWSYAESPYCDYGEGYFDEVRAILERKYSNYIEDIEQRFESIIVAMELSMAKLNEEGLFGYSEVRMGIVINAEVMLPDFGNTERALRLNHRQALAEWLVEVAE